MIWSLKRCPKLPSDAMRALLARLPTVADVDAQRHGKPLGKGKTRLEVTIEQRPLTKVDEKAFKSAVWRRDRNRCRCCGRKVQQVLARVPERGEVHHIHGRRGDLRFEVKSAILVCLRCHERLTGKVNAHRMQVLATETFAIRGEWYTNANCPITFTEKA